MKIEKKEGRKIENKQEKNKEFNHIFNKNDYNCNYNRFSE